MSIFEEILVTDTFSDWLNTWNAYSYEANPLGTGTVEFHNIQITGNIYYGTTATSVLYKKEIEGYFLDTSFGPTVTTDFGRKFVEFSPTATNIIYFDFNFTNFYDISEDRYISLGYFMDSSQTANVILHADYYISKDGELLSSTPTGTSRITLAAISTQDIFDVSETLTILGSDVSSRNDLCYVKLMRLGDNASDTHNGNFNLLDIKII